MNQGLKTLLPFGTVTLCVLVTACNPNSESTTMDGSCSSSFLDSYNSVVNTWNDYKIAVDMPYNRGLNLEQKRKAVQNACRSFFNSHSGVTCRAADLRGNEKDARSSDLKKNCDYIESLAGVYSVTTPTPTPTPVPTSF